MKSSDIQSTALHRMTQRLTECADLQDGHHGANLDRGRVVEVLSEMGAGDYPGHDTTVGIRLEWPGVVVCVGMPYP